MKRENSPTAWVAPKWSTPYLALPVANVSIILKQFTKNTGKNLAHMKFAFYTIFQIMHRIYNYVHLLYNICGPFGQCVL